MLCVHCENQTDSIPCSACGQEPRLRGEYTLTHVLGRGAHGTTFAALGHQGPVAIKELHLGRHRGPKASALFEREARVLKQLDHPAIPSLHEHFVVGAGRHRTL